MAYQSQIKKVPGKKTKEIMLFALSTCLWCRKTKSLLKSLGLAYDYVDVDLLSGKDQAEAYDIMWQHHHSASFPTIIINNGEDVIIGFEEEKIEKIK